MYVCMADTLCTLHKEACVRGVGVSQQGSVERRVLIAVYALLQQC